MLSNTQILRLSLLFALFLSGVFFAPAAQTAGSDSTSQAQTPSSAAILLKTSIPVERLELASEALAVWRQYSAYQPTLLLLSNDPMLQRVPKQVGNETTQLVDPAAGQNPLQLGSVPILELAVNEVNSLAETASREELLRATDFGQPSPLFIPSMTLDIALRQGWFSKLAWAVPLPDADMPMMQEALYEQFEKSAIADTEELASLKVKGLVAHAVLRGVPVTVAALPHLDELTGPVLVHIDQSYFQGMYNNEVATPLIPMVTETLRALRERNIPTLAVTFGNGDMDRRVSLDVRFLQDIVSTIVENPDMLDKTLPTNWQRQAQRLYLANFFKAEEIYDLALAMNQEDPDSAWVKFALYRSAVEVNKGSEALKTLSEAVKRDKMYAFEYFDLSEIAYDKSRPDEAMRMLTLAAQALPENVQVKLNMARLATDMGETETALHLVEQLQKHPWSPVYYAEMPDYLDSFAAFLKEQKVSTPQTESVPSAVDSRRQRILK